MDDKCFDIKKLLLGTINRKLTFLFTLVALVAPTIGIYFFYFISVSLLPEEIELFSEKLAVLQTTAILIIIGIAVDAGIIGFFISRSISKPIKEIHRATQELEKGNFDVRTNIRTGDEIEELGNAINKATEALGKMEEERKQIDNAKTEFLSITSHELRSPMTPMKAQLQMLEKEYFGKLTEEQKNSISIILRNADRLDKIILDFLEISRIEAARLRFSFKKTDLKKTVEETVELMKGSAKEKNIRLIVNISDELPIIEVDPDRISQVLRNLIDNAIKFSDKNSEIIITAKAEKDHILFSVKDHGIGITPENQIRIFEPFYQVEKTLNRKHGGTGLGLAICRGIVEAQKGKIWVESKPLQGSTFYFTVPLKPVKEIEPIKILFSPKKNLENKIKEEFKAALGPMGIVEFNDLKNKNALWKKDIFEYIDMLKKECILTEEKGEEFKKNINIIFGDEKEKIEKDTSNQKNENKTIFTLPGNPNKKDVIQKK